MKPTRVLVVPVDGQTATVQNVASLKDWRDCVGGDLEAITPAGTRSASPQRLRGWAAYVDENGLLRRLEPNPNATRLAVAAGWVTRPDQPIVGPAVFFGFNGSPQEQDVPDPLVELAALIGLTVTDVS